MKKTRCTFTRKNGRRVRSGGRFTVPSIGWHLRGSGDGVDRALKREAADEAARARYYATIPSIEGANRLRAERLAGWS